MEGLKGRGNGRVAALEKMARRGTAVRLPHTLVGACRTLVWILLVAPSLGYGGEEDDTNEDNLADPIPAEVSKNDVSARQFSPFGGGGGNFGSQSGSLNQMSFGSTQQSQNSWSYGKSVSEQSYSGYTFSSGYKDIVQQGQDNSVDKLIEIVIMKLFTAAAIRNNLMSVFASLIRQAQLPQEFSGQLLYVYNALRLREVRTVDICNNLKSLTNRPPQDQFISLFEEIRKASPPYLEQSIRSVQSFLSERRIDIQSVTRMNSNIKIDIFSGIPPNLIDAVSQPTRFKPMTETRANPRIAQRFGKLVANVLAALSDDSIVLTQPLFAALFLNLPMDASNPTADVTRQRVVDTLRTNTISSWKNMITNLKPNDKQEPFALMQMMLRYMTNDATVPAQMKESSNTLLPFIRDNSYNSINIPEYTKSPDTSMTLQGLASVLSNSMSSRQTDRWSSGSSSGFPSPQGSPSFPRPGSSFPSSPSFPGVQPSSFPHPGSSFPVAQSPSFSRPGSSFPSSPSFPGPQSPSFPRPGSSFPSSPSFPGAQSPSFPRPGSFTGAQPPSFPHPGSPFPSSSSFPQQPSPQPVSSNGLVLPSADIQLEEIRQTNTFEHLLPQTQPGSAEDNRMRPLRSFLSQPNIRQMLGPSFKPEAHSNQGQLLRAILKEAIKLQLTASNYELDSVAKEYVNLLNQQSSISTIDLNYPTLLTALPPPGPSEINMFEKISVFLRQATLKKILGPSFNPASYDSKGALLRHIFEVALSVRMVQEDSQLVQAINYYINKILTTGTGAEPIEWLAISHTFITRTVDLNALFRAIDSDRLTKEARTAMKSINKFFSTVFKPEIHLNGFNFLNYNTKGEWLQAFYKYLVSLNSVSIEWKAQFEQIIPYIRLTGPGAEPIEYAD